MRITEFCRDWRAALVSLEGETDVYLSITARYESVDYEILKLSNYNPDFDEGKKFFKTRVRKFDDNVGYFTHKVRDSGVGRFLTRNTRDNVAYVLEPGEELLKYNAEREGLTEKEYVGLMRRSPIGKLVVRRERKVNRRRLEASEARADDADTQALNLKEENAFLFAERNEAVRRAARFGAE